MRAQRAPEAFRRGIRSTYVKGLDTPGSLPNPTSLPKRNLFYLYEGPRNHQQPTEEELGLPI